MLLSFLVQFLMLPLFVRCAPLYTLRSGSEIIGNQPHLAYETQAVELGKTAFSPPNTPPLTSYAETADLDENPSPSAEVQIFFQPPSLPSSSEISTSIDGPLVMGYYPDWAGPSFPPEKVDFERLDWVDFAFALPDQNFNLTWDNADEAPALLRRLVIAAHLQGKHVKLSVGGWTGSKYFSPAVATNQSRNIFAENIRIFYQEFNVDGIEIDWEYPGHAGNDGNEVNSNDSANFLLFLQLLRTVLPSTARITAATQTSPFVDSNGSPLTDVSGFAEVLDWILLMNYDVWGSSSTPGPNAPFYDACHNSSQPQANAVGAYNSWTSAGFPASKLVLGVPAYGYISKSNAASLKTRSVPRVFGPNFARNTVDTSDSQAANETVYNEDGSSEDGQVQFRDLVTQGALVRNDTDSNGLLYNSSGGYTRVWDDCSSTPFLRSVSADQVITYDDPMSLRMKAEFANQVGMLGVNMFDVHGDTDQWDLIDSVRAGLGLS